MNDNDLILAELKKISTWTDMQRKMTKRSLIFVAVIIPALIIFGFVMERRLTNTLQNPTSTANADWYDVDSDVRRGEFEKAIRLGEELIQTTPVYPEAHRRLAGAYLAAGKIQKAREHYAEAFRLFPSEENERLLIAIDKRNKDESPPTGGEAIGPSSPR